MYPTKELTHLVDRKVALQRRIKIRRILVAADFERAAVPLGWLDRLAAFWQQVTPFAKLAAVPLGLFATRTLYPRRKLLGFLLRWSPIAFGLLRGLGGANSKSQSRRG